MAGRKNLFESLNYDDYPDDDDFRQFHILVGHMKLPKINLVFCSELPESYDVSGFLEDVNDGYISDMVVCEGTLPQRYHENPKFWNKVITIEDGSGDRRFAGNLEDIGLRVLSADEVNSVIYDNIRYFDPSLFISKIWEIREHMLLLDTSIRNKFGGHQDPLRVASIAERYSDRIEYYSKVMEDLRKKEKSVYYTGDTSKQALRWDYLYQLGRFHQFKDVAR